MRRRKKDKTKEKVPTNSAEYETLDSSGRGGSSGSKSSKDADASNSGVTVTAVSPPQQRKRSLLGSLGSMRELVEQVSRCWDGEVPLRVPLVRFTPLSLSYTQKESPRSNPRHVPRRRTERVSAPNQKESGDNCCRVVEC